MYEDPFILYDITTEEYLEKMDERVVFNGENLPYIRNSRNSSAKHFLGSIQGGTIGYGKVTSTSDALANNGRTISIFSNVADGGTVASKIFPYPPVNPKDHRRGILMSQTDYRSDNTKIREIENFYNFPLATSISGVKTGFSFINYLGNCDRPYDFCDLKFSIYQLTSEQVNKTKTIERNYDNTGITNIETTSEYFYENPAYTQMTKTISTEGKSNKINVGGILKDSRTIQTSMKYPYDFTGSTTLSGMTSSHIFSPVIEKTTKLIITNTSGATTEKQLNFEKTTFNKYGNIYLPQKIETQHGAGALQTAITFTSYDNITGNLLGYTQRNGLSNAFTYYGTSDNGKTNLVKTQENNLGHKTTYDYVPLVGLQTVTDPNSRKTTFTYDNLNRLSNIKDQDDNFVKSYSYNYAPLRVSADGTIGGVLPESNDCGLGTSRIERSDKTSTSGKYMDNPCLEVILKPGFDTERKQYEAKIGPR